MQKKKVLKNQKRVPVKRKIQTVKKKQGRFKRFMVNSILILFGTGLLCFFIGAGYIYYKYSDGLPDVLELKNYQPSTISRVYDDRDDLLAEFYIEKRIVIPFRDIPLRIKQATLAVEDSNFYSHFGIDPKAIARATIKNLQAGHVVEGGSTITQQLAKTLFLTFEQKLERKIREAILAVRMELVFDKDEILEMYLNQIYYGHGTYGVEAAARAYFGKTVADLSITECAMLAGLPKAPNHYSPYKNMEKALKRRDHVIRRMAVLGFITEREKNEALEAKLVLGQVADPVNKSPYFVEYIRQFIQEKYGTNKLYRDGLRIFTSLNYANQLSAQKAVRDGLRKADKRFGYRGPVLHLEQIPETAGLDTLLKEWNTNPDGEFLPLESGNIVKGVVTGVKPSRAYVYLGGAWGSIPLENMDWARKPNPRVDAKWAKVKNAQHALSKGDVVFVQLTDKNKNGNWILQLEQEPEVQAGLISMDPNTGFINAMVGGYDFNKSQFNRATQAVRQPGSAFKPVIFAAAIEDGYTPSSIVIDSPIIFKEKEDTFDKWKPVNFSQKFYGPTSLRTALTHSRNVITIKLLQNTGVPRTIDMARRLGIKSALSKNLSIALGSSGVTLHELMGVYSVFANGGKRRDLIPVRFIKDRNDKIIYTPEQEFQQVISPGLAYLITSLMQSVVEQGTAKDVKVLNRPVAGKTGTTNDYVDAWFMGYTPELVTGVWVGKDRDEPMGVNETGNRAAIPIWLQYMQEALEGLPVKNFPVSDDVVFMRVNLDSGLPTRFDDPNSRFEVFLKDNLPSKMQNFGGLNTGNY